ncbi:PrsW family intramembrane metalloprotease [Amnibacterium flavum]|uniref:PrsW family intramembrane metalloprotease n=1 Tax=Amnibacterium flavum TaxID=2173173 RepID=A0A2V1HPR6_9MICO|nr:PrsW family intramembrane metalloprotease [Amnibacterium flavum]PVZ93602.1 PrsW family intramembrane metalloprotease [Amnibacterium flavum]
MSAPQPPEWQSRPTGRKTFEYVVIPPADGRASTWQTPPAPAPVAARTAMAATVLVSIGIALAALLLFAVIAYLVLALGFGSVIIAAIAALIPLAIVVLVIRWIDRWEPEPRAALLFAALWGAGVAVAGALIFDLGVQIATAVAGTAPQNEVLQAVVQAPLVEEGLKGFGVLIILWVGRRYIDGPIDGLVYAATLAAGFAFTENVLYFGSAIVEGGVGSLIPVFIARGLFSPFAHVIFTSCTGLALGYGSRRTAGPALFGWYLIGLIPAVALHALWNGALYVVQDVIGYYLLVQVPIFAAWIVLIVLLRRAERRMTGERLAEYATVGWFTPAEVSLVSSPAGRRTGLAWARSQPARPGAPDKVTAMKAFVRDSTRLAHTRQRVLRGRAAIGATPDERALLDAVVADRRALLA